MRRPGPELLDEISESACSGSAAASPPAWPCSAVLETGAEGGDFAVDDPVVLANFLYASGLGALQLARVGLLVTESAPGVPTLGSITPEQVTDHLVRSALALVAPD